MKSGIAKNFCARLANNSFIASAYGKILNEELYELNKAVFSPCSICKSKPPQWQIKARDAIVDEKKEDIT